jgi:hypothetical protein
MPRSKARLGGMGMGSAPSFSQSLTWTMWLALAHVRLSSLDHLLVSNIIERIVSCPVPASCKSVCKCTYGVRTEGLNELTLGPYLNGTEGRPLVLKISNVSKIKRN